MIAIDAVKRTIVLVKKFGLYLCVPVFLMIAYSYTNSAYSKYKVTAKIALRDGSADLAVSDIKSKYLVSKALEQLPFEASYYDGNSPRDEVFGNDLPVRMVFDHPCYTHDEVWLNIEVTGTNSFTLTHGDTIAYHEFNEPVHEWYGDFKVVRKPRAQYSQASYLVRLDDPDKIQEQYYNNLRVETVGDDGLIVSIVSGSPQKGVDFLNKLLQLYDGSTHSASRYAYARLGGSGVAGNVTILEKPGSNVERAGISSFWVYFIAFFAGLLIPAGWPVIKRRGSNVKPFKLSGMPKLNHEPRRVAAKQLGVKVARYRRLLFREA